MKGGIPQGSTLGPLLFLIYMNTLPSSVNDALLLQYADNTMLACSGPTPAAAACVMNQQLTLTHDWLVKHRMKLNIQKSRVLWFYNKRQKKQQFFYLCISIDDVTLQTTEKQKYLGLVFDNCLSWDFQVSIMCVRKCPIIYILLICITRFLIITLLSC